jgi:translocation and assembly module TamB
MRHAARRITNSVIAFSIIFGAFLFVFYTEAGLQFVLSTISSAAGNRLTFVNVHGQLTGPLTIAELKFATPTTKFTAKNIEFDWQPFDLIFGKLSILKLHANNLELNLPAPVKSAPPLKSKLPAKKKGLFNNFTQKQYLTNIRLQDVQLNHIIITQAGASQPIVINSISCLLTAANNQLSSLTFILQAPTAKVAISGNIGKTYDLSWNINIPRLQDLIPKATGYISSQGQLHGTKTQPIIHSVLQINNLQYGYGSIAELQSDINLNFSDSKPTTVSLVAKKVQYGRYLLDQTGISGTASVTGTTKQPAAKFNLHMTQTTVSLLTSYQIYQLTLAGADLIATLDKNGFTSKGQVNLTNQPPITGTFAINKNKTLNGEAKWHITNQQILPIGTDKVKNVRASLDADLKISGSTFSPKLLCTGNLYDGSLEIPDLNLKITNIKAHSEMTTAGIAYAGTLNSGNGSIEVKGSTAFVAPDFTTKIAITGKDFRAANTKSYKVNVNPNLNLVITPLQLTLNGTITIPKANLKPQDFSSSETLPEEVTITGGSTKNLIPTTPFNIYSTIKLVLGDDVKINIKGLTGNVIGQLTINEDPHKGTTGIGLLAIKNGVFNAYGQELTIQKGTLSFSGGSIDDPVIYVEAVKYLKSAQTAAGNSLAVGAKVQGSVRKPVTTLFSDPATLSSTDILSYLVLGQPASQINDISQKSSQDQIGLLLSAASLLNVGGSSGVAAITGNIRKTFGLDTLGLETQSTYIPSAAKGITPTTAFFLGKYLTPSLYVSYGISYLSSSDIENIFRVRYRITKGFQVQSEASNLGTGVDLLYSFERD